MSDQVVGQQAAGAGVTVSSFDLGILSFNAPATPGTYTVNLTGGSISTTPTPDNTLLVDGLSALYESNGLTLGDFEFTVVPEPTTMAVLGCGGLLALLRRKRKA